MAGWRIIANVVRKLVGLPFALTGVAADIARNPGDRDGALIVPSAVDNMSPRHPFIRALQAIPVAPLHHGPLDHHRRGNEGAVEEGNDGVVEYRSAHIGGVESELVVQPSSHSTQGNPRTIEEVRRRPSGDTRA